MSIDDLVFAQPLLIEVRLTFLASPRKIDNLWNKGQYTYRFCLAPGKGLPFLNDGQSTLDLSKLHYSKESLYSDRENCPAALV